MRRKSKAIHGGMRSWMRRSWIKWAVGSMLLYNLLLLNTDRCFRSAGRTALRINESHQKSSWRWWTRRGRRGKCSPGEDIVKDIDDFVLYSTKKPIIASFLYFNSSSGQTYKHILLQSTFSARSLSMWKSWQWIQTTNPPALSCRLSLPGDLENLHEISLAREKQVP